MRRTLKTLSPCLVAFLLMLTVAFAGNAQELQKKLEGLKGISGIEKLESDHYAEKYLVRITQPVDHKNPAAGTFTQRVIVAHVGFDRPTILVTEGYGAAYALNPRYQEELSKLLDANMVFVEYRYFLESTPTPCNWEYLTAENSAYCITSTKHSESCTPVNGSAPASAKADKPLACTVPGFRTT